MVSEPSRTEPDASMPPEKPYAASTSSAAQTAALYAATCSSPSGTLKPITSRTAATAAPRCGRTSSHVFAPW